jgi:hypothetical protein
MTVTIIFIAVYFAVSIGIGIYSRKAAVNVDNFVLGGRNIGPWISAFAYGTTYFSAVIFVGYAGQFGWNFGLSATWIGIGNAIIGSLLPWIILGRRTRIMTQHIGSRTMPDFFGIRYDSPALRIAASIQEYADLLFRKNLCSHLHYLLLLLQGYNLEILFQKSLQYTNAYSFPLLYLEFHWSNSMRCRISHKHLRLLQKSLSFSHVYTSAVCFNLIIPIICIL